MPLPINPPIEVKPRGLPAVILATFEEAQAWAIQERDVWMPWRDFKVSPPLVTFVSELWSPLGQITNATSQALQQPTDSAIVSNSRNQIETIVRQYENGPLIASQSPDGIRLLQRFAAGDEMGAIVEAALMVNHRSFPIVVWHQNQGYPVDLRPIVVETVKSVFWDKVTAEHVAAGTASQQVIFEEFGRRLDGRIQQFDRKRCSMALGGLR